MCYCADCQAYLRHLGKADLLDAAGGTDIFQTTPDRLRIETGADRLACVRLTPTGVLRWYADCCGAPIGNTAPTAKIPFVGLIIVGAPPATRDAAFGPPTAHVNVAGATGPAPRERAGLGLLAGVLWRIAKARISGRWRRTPFFNVETDKPARPPRILTPDERAALDGRTAPGV